MEYQAKGTYPPVTVERKHPLYAREILTNLGAQISETTAVNSYFYAYLMVKHKAPELAQVFFQLNRVETLHLEIMGELAMLLGADPRFWERRRNGLHYWSPCYGLYAREPQAILQGFIRAERETVQKYNAQIQIIRDANVGALLQRVKADEEVHLELLTELAKQW